MTDRMSRNHRASKIGDAVHMLWKRCLSYTKRVWNLTDYPIKVARHEPDPIFKASRFKHHRFVASVIGWHLTAGGDSKREALEALAVEFASQKLKKGNEGVPLPRPGTTIPIGLASQDRINSHGDLMRDFTDRVLQLEWAWVSDESTLWDFHTDETNEALCAKIKEVYGMDVSDIESEKLPVIFDRIKAKRSST